MKNDCRITLHVSADLMKKFLYVAKAEGRTPNNQFLLMLRNNLAYFEKTKGRIRPDQMAEIDLSAYQPSDDGEF